MSILPVCLPAWVSGEQNALPDPFHGRVIPRWNCLDREIDPRKKIPLRTPCT